MNGWSTARTRSSGSASQVERISFSFFRRLTSSFSFPKPRTGRTLFAGYWMKPIVVIWQSPCVVFWKQLKVKRSRSMLTSPKLKVSRLCAFDWWLRGQERMSTVEDFGGLNGNRQVKWSLGRALQFVEAINLGGTWSFVEPRLAVFYWQWRPHDVHMRSLLKWKWFCHLHNVAIFTLISINFSFSSKSTIFD